MAKIQLGDLAFDVETAGDPSSPLVLLLHGFITSNLPMGAPIEWNFMVVYGAFALFWAHPEVNVLDLESPRLVASRAAELGRNDASIGAGSDHQVAR